MYGIFMYIYHYLVTYILLHYIVSVVRYTRYTHQTSSNTYANIPRLHVWKMCRLFCSFDIMRPQKNIKISEANHCNKTVTGQGILHLFFPSLNYAMNFREGSPQIRMLSCFFPKPSLPHTLWGSVFGLTFTPPEARPLGGPRERVCPWKVTSKTQ